MANIAAAQVERRNTINGMFIEDAYIYRFE
jgi:hypothetical protein